MEWISTPCCVIPLTLSRIEKDEIYKVKIKNIYDPSKFWMVKDYKELAVFMKHLNAFYSKSCNKKCIPQESIAENLDCIAHQNGLFYRAIIMKVALPESSKIRVFMVDFGLVLNIEAKNVTKIYKKHCDVPRFAIRACLAYVKPTDPFKPWSVAQLHQFCGIISKKRLFVKIIEIDVVEMTVYVDIRTESCGSISDLMVQSGHALFNDTAFRECKYENLSRFKQINKYIHLFPTFHAIETGIVPSSIWEHNLVKDSILLDHLYQGYFDDTVL